MLHTRNRYNWHCRFQEVKNVTLLTDDGRRTTHDDARRPIE